MLASGRSLDPAVEPTLLHFVAFLAPAANKTEESTQSKPQTAVQVYASYVAGDGLETQYDWLVLFIFMVGTYVFTMGCALLYVDANNAQYPGQMAAWTANGRQGKKPRSYPAFFASSEGAYCF